MIERKCGFLQNSYIALLKSIPLRHKAHKELVKKYETFLCALSALVGYKKTNFYCCSINCISQFILTSSLTTIPPASVTALQVNPKSLRFILPLMVKPAFVFP